MPLTLLLFLSSLTVSPDTAFQRLLRQGDTLFAHMQYQDAAVMYDSAAALRPSHAEPFWKLARVYIAESETVATETRRDLIERAAVYARRAIDADSTCAQGYSWLAASLGNLAMYEGSKTKVRLANDIKFLLDRAIGLDPKDDIARSILGSFYRALGNISWLERSLADIFLGGLPAGGYEESEEQLRMAVALAPRVLRHQFELALLYLDWDRKDDARRVLRVAERLPVLMASDFHTHQKVLELLETMQ